MAAVYWLTNSESCSARLLRLTHRSIEVSAMPQNLQDIALAPAKATSPEAYFKLQVRAWTRFDPSKADLIDIARAVEAGTAFVSAIEVARVVEGISEVDDPDVREQFETLAAAERILRRLEQLPEAVRDKLRVALGNDETEERVAS
jgi:hypothetical protein